MPKRVRNLLCALCFVLGLVGLPTFYQLTLYNLITVEFLKTLMVPDISAMERQADLTLINAIAEWLPHQTKQVDLATQECGMLPALIQAQYYYRLRDWEKMFGWIDVAKNSPAFPVQQRSILVPIAASIRSDGKIVIPFLETEWRHDSNNRNVDIRILSPEEVQIILPNQQKVRDIFIYSWQQGVNVAYQPSLQLEVWLRQGTYFTVETVTNQKTRVRHISYYQGEGKWTSFDLQLDADLLSVISFSLGEPSESAASESSIPVTSVPFYEAIIRAPLLPLSAELGTCNVIVQSGEP